jgi:septum site-determining protein MinD
MATIVSIHSFRGGTGKSNATANLATLLAASGQRVGVIDTDIQSPGIHVLFGLAGDDIAYSLNDFLWRGSNIEDAARDVTPPECAATGGRLFLIPSSIKPGEIARVLREGYDAQRLTEGLRRLVTQLHLDVLLIDTHPGLHEETLLSLVIAHVLVIVLRPDQQDYEGTGVTVKVAQGLQVPRTMLVVNKTPPAFDAEAVRHKVEDAYGCRVAAVLPHSDEMMNLASEAIFVLRYPDHPMTAQYRQVAADLVA